MANSKENSLFVVDTVGPVCDTGETVKIIGWNIYASNATWSITLKTLAGLVIFQSDNNSPTPVLLKPLPTASGIDCTELTSCTMRIYYES